MHIEDVIVRAHATAVAKGHVGNAPRPIPEHAALLHSEVSELFEAWRDGLEADQNYYKLPGNPASRDMYDDEGNLGKPVGIPSEVADVVIRACQFAAEYRIDLVRAIEEKMAYNDTRPLKHGRKH